MAWGKLKDMSMDDEAIGEMPMPIPFDKPKGPVYPYGLRICLTHAELKKLGLEPDCELGDVIDLRAFAEVTSVSTNETTAGKECRVELQITKLAVENESEEIGEESGEAE